MRLYWTAGSIPEIARLSPGARREALKACQWKAYRHWQSWLGLALCAGLCVVGFILGRDWGSTTLALVATAGGGLIGGALAGQIITHQMRPYLREWVNSAGSKW